VPSHGQHGLFLPLAEGDDPEVRRRRPAGPRGLAGALPKRLNLTEWSSSGTLHALLVSLAFRPQFRAEVRGSHGKSVPPSGATGSVIRTPEEDFGSMKLYV